jgi:hypothetical protein
MLVKTWYDYVHSTVLVVTTQLLYIVAERQSFQYEHMDLPHYNAVEREGYKK